MDMRSKAARIVVITLAVIGALVVLGGSGVLFMHVSMMGGSSLHGFFFWITAMCRAMMG